jgi:hypothetical protein
MVFIKTAKINILLLQCCFVKAIREGYKPDPATPTVAAPAPMYLAA